MYTLSRKRKKHDRLAEVHTEYDISENFFYIEEEKKLFSEKMALCRSQEYLHLQKRE